MKNVTNQVLMLLIVGFTLFSCNKEDVNDLASPDSNSTQDGISRCNEELIVQFLAGQYQDAGDVTITQEVDTAVSILITMQNGYSLNKYHIYFGAEQELPKTKRHGNPKIGKFNYNSGNLGSVPSIELRIPINPDGDKPVVIAVHGEVSGPTNETAWGEGEQITLGGSWAMFNRFVIDVCNTNSTNFCTGFQTLTQDQWGDPNSLGGSILSDDFIQIAGLDNIISVGCNDSTEYDNGDDLLAYLPDNGAIVNLTTSYFNNTSSVSATAGELIGLRLNLAADANIPTFSTAETALGEQEYIEFNDYFGLTVNQILLDGQQVLTGCLTNNLVELTGAVEAINNSYANGNSGEDILFCPFGN